MVIRLDLIVLILQNPLGNLVTQWFGAQSAEKLELDLWGFPVYLLLSTQSYPVTQICNQCSYAVHNSSHLYSATSSAITPQFNPGQSYDSPCN